MTSKVYVFDLDHTLCRTEKIDNKYWDYKNAKPIEERIEKVNMLYDQGNTIIIESARGFDKENDFYEISQFQLENWGLKYHKLRTATKFPADFYIDDKGINSEDYFG